MFCETDGCNGDFYGEANGKQLCRDCYDKEDIDNDDEVEENLQDAEQWWEEMSDEEKIEIYFKDTGRTK